MNRYDRNRIITLEEQAYLADRKVCVIGCGGIGGYSIEMLARFGIGTLTVVDGDVFCESNLNRQLLCLSHSIGKSKAFTAGERIAAINADIHVNVISAYVDSDNITEIIDGHDIVLDALDSNDVRGIVLNACAVKRTPFVYGAIAGWYGQVATVFPEDIWFRDFLEGLDNKGIEVQIGNPAFTPAMVASIQVSEAVKLLLNKGKLLRNQLLYIDMLNGEIDYIQP